VQRITAEAGHNSYLAWGDVAVAMLDAVGARLVDGHDGIGEDLLMHSD
jgi:hypothetical protein